MNDKDSQQAQKKLVSITIQDLRAIKSRANKYFFDKAKPNDYEGGDFLTLCYFLAILDQLKIDAEFVEERSFQEPVE